MHQLLRAYLDDISYLKEQGVCAKEKAQAVVVYLVESITKYEYVLQKVWNDIDYRLDVVRVTKKNSYRTFIGKIN
jgi:hypothetical protein